MKKLNVFHEKTLIGELFQNGKNVWSFSYTPEWLQTEIAVALSPGIPLSNKIFNGKEVESFFENLLPEGDVLDFISKALHISSNNIFGLLERFGGDTAGAFSVLPVGVEVSDTPHYLPVTKDQIKQWFKNTKGIPLTIKGEQSRMSLSGAQDKMTVFIDSNGTLSIPLGSAPSSHIIKPSVNHRQDIPQSAINEVFIMTLARKIRLDVAETYYDPELYAAIITRYDRKIEQGRLIRLHQNDLCQTLGIPSGKKYEAEGGPSLTDCFDAILKQSSQPAKDKKRLIEWVVFNLLVGNMDSHAKNLSLMMVNNKKQLTPFYDMLCTSVYPQLSQKFAFKIGGENRPDWIMLRHWERFANDIDTKPKFVFNIINNMLLLINEFLPIVAETLIKIALSNDEKTMIVKIEKSIYTSISKMESRIHGKLLD